MVPDTGILSRTRPLTFSPVAELLPKGITLELMLLESKWTALGGNGLTLN